MTKLRKVIKVTHASAPHEDRLIIKLSSEETSIQGSCSVTEIFPTIKSLTAELFADDWKVANQINRMDREEYAAKYSIDFPKSVPEEFKSDFSVPRPLRELANVLDSLKHKSDRQDGISAIAEHLAAEIESDINNVTNLVNFMYAGSEWQWDPVNQGPSNYNGKAWGAEVSLSANHAVGNWFVSGYIGAMRIRVFKTHSTVQVYLTTTREFDMSRCDLNFSVHNKGEFFDWIKGLCQRQAGK